MQHSLNLSCQDFKRKLMRHLLLLSSLSLLLFACKRDNTNNAVPFASDLAGKWRLISAKDNLTDATTTKPPAISGNVDITIVFSTSVAGVMNGVTPTNTLSCDFQVGPNRTLSIPSLSMTEIVETSWGLMFLDNIPHAQDFIFTNDGKLNINTSTNKTLTFIRQ